MPDPASFPHDLQGLYLIGREVTALLGTATVVLLYVGLLRRERRVALLSGLLLAICPLHVINSHYATVDVPATFFLVVAFVLALRAARQQGARSALLAGAAVGLAAATKYNAGLFLIPVLLAPVLVGASRQSRAWWLGVPAGAAVGFLIACPFVFSHEFHRGIMFELRHARVGGTLAFVDTGLGWTYHLVRGLPVGLGYPLLAASALGVLVTLRLPSAAGRIALFWITLYLFVIGFGKERFIRYLVPMTPFLAVLAASGPVWLIGRASRFWARMGAAAIVAAVAALTLLYTGWQVFPLATMDVRDGLMLESEPPVIRGATVGLPSLPWYFHPPVSPYNAGTFSRDWFEEWNARAGRRIVVTEWDSKVLRARKPEVFCLSDLESADPLRLRDPTVVAFVETLGQVYSGREEAVGVTAPLPWLAPDREWAPPDWLYPSPGITVYYNWSE